MEEKLRQLKNNFPSEQQKQVDLRKLILPVNNNYVSVPTDEFQEKISPTDYAVTRGVSRFDENTNRPMCFYWTHNTEIPHGRRDVGIVPVMRLDLQAMLAQKWKINQTNHTIEFGYYPKSKLNFNVETSQRTGKYYRGNLQTDGSFDYFWERINESYSGNQIVVEARNMKTPQGWSFYSNEMLPRPEETVHLQVEPLTFKIENWKDMPAPINPNGNGTAKYMDVHTVQAITGGIPYERIQAYLNKEFMREAFVFSQDLVKTMAANQNQRKDDMETTL